jgi:hypothetical protein
MYAPCLQETACDLHVLLVCYLQSITDVVQDILKILILVMSTGSSCGGPRPGAFLGARQAEHFGPSHGAGGFGRGRAGHATFIPDQGHH